MTETGESGREVGHPLVEWRDVCGGSCGERGGWEPQVVGKRGVARSSAVLVCGFSSGRAVVRRFCPWGRARKLTWRFVCFVEYEALGRGSGEGDEGGSSPTVMSLPPIMCITTYTAGLFRVELHPNV